MRERESDRKIIKDKERGIKRKIDDERETERMKKRL
jgi:hypothetical protein